MNLSPAQLAYLAGLIDGEGSLECQRYLQPRGRTPRFVLRLAFAFATKEPLRTIGQWIGHRPKRFPATSPNRQPTHRMSIAKNAAVPILRACLPYLILKQRQAALILAIEAVRNEHSPSRAHDGHAKFCPVPAGAVAKMERMHRDLRALKSNKGRK